MAENTERERGSERERETPREREAKRRGQRNKEAEVGEMKRVNEITAVCADIGGAYMFPHFVDAFDLCVLTHTHTLIHTGLSLKRKLAKQLKTF